MRSGELQFFADLKRLLELDQGRLAIRYAVSDAELSLLIAPPAVRFSAQVDRASLMVTRGERREGQSTCHLLRHVARRPIGGPELTLRVVAPTIGTAVCQKRT